MDDELIQKLVDGLRAETTSLDFVSYVLVALVCLVSTLIGVFFSSYMQEKGKSYATKEDFNNLLEQTKATTKETESIKSEISKFDWRASKQWELRFKVYTEVLQSLADWRISIEKISKTAFKSDGSWVAELKDEDKEKIESAGSRVETAFVNLARIESISQIVLPSDKAERIRNLRKSAVKGAIGVSGKAAFENVMNDIIDLEREISLEAKSQLFSDHG